MVLNDNEVTDILDKYDYPKSIVDKVVDAYNLIKFQDINKDKTLEELDATLNAIAFNLEQGGYDTAEGASREFSSNKHINYFDNFGEFGLSDEIVEVLSNIGAGTDVLKGLKSFKDDVLEDKKTGIKIVTLWEKIPPDSDVLMNVVIFHKNENGEYEEIFYWEK